ncbi:hypothetical protein FG93_01936 [Bosea sp. LC85]|uniref:hypothetical protein n=1 Tax=Bosea sp. LC85 TaxID=1502851 RepID=UPI0004E31D83|nr:hypothetical protein [Bosea sp. LC85]KFC73192.1 hypothetical protein FG93_01936 [Bosea sp. LC85]
MADTWPATLPQKLQSDDYSEQEAENRIRSANDVGPAKVRRRTTANVQPVSGSLIMSLDQKALLKSFVSETLLGGALPFWFPNPNGGADWLVRFADGGLPTWAPFGAIEWRASFKLEVLP